LHPIIGTIAYDDYGHMKIADIPGLIDGAHKGIGLGHDFLRHIERTKYLLFVIDMAGVDGRNPVDDYRNLKKELKLYSAELARRPSMIVANKMDLPEADGNYKAFICRTRQKPYKISAALGEGVDELRKELRKRIEATRSDRS
jgi:GTP-binding protein